MSTFLIKIACEHYLTENDKRNLVDGLNSELWSGAFRECRASISNDAEQLAKYLSDFDELSGKQAAFLVRNFDPETECYHLNVKVYSRLYAAETRYQPAEYERKAQCNDCGKWMDIEDVPEEAEGRDE